MNFHNLKRRELQALCKKHKIPANLTNLEMAEKLTAHLAVNEKPLTQGRGSCLKGLDENVSENESDFENRPAKKVRFSPENEIIEFEKSEVRGRRKSVMFKDKGSAAIVTSSCDKVNEEVRELRRTRRGKLLEGSEVESKGGKRAMKVGALRDSGTADDVVNGEVRDIRRSRRGKSLEGNGVENRGKEATKIDPLEDNRTVYDVANGEVKEVRRSRRGKLPEGSEGESKGGKRVKKVEALNDNGIVDDVLNGGVREVRRSRRGKLRVGNDFLNGKLSAAGDVPSLNLRNEEHKGLKKRISSKRVALDKERRVIEGVIKGSRRGSSVKNLRSGKEEYCEDVGGSKEAGTESACVQLVEAGVRRSSRHVAKVDNVQVLSKHATKKKNVTSGRSRSKIALEVKENSGVDDISKTVVVEGKLRRSQRNASKLECSISMEGTDVITIADNNEETKNRTMDTGLEGETAVTDEGNSNGRSSRQITRSSKRSGRVVSTAEIEKIAQKEKGRSMSTNIEVEDSSTVDIPADPDAQAASTGAPIDTVWDNCISAELSANASEFESTIPAESNFPTEGQAAPGTHGTSIYPAFHDNDDMQTQGETFIREERNEGTDSKPALQIRTLLTSEQDCMDGNLEHVNDNLDKKHGAIVESSSSKAHSKAMLQNFEGKEREQLNLEEHNSYEPENSCTLIDACQVGCSYIVNECRSGAIQTTLMNANESKQEEYTNAMHSMKTLKQREEVSPMQMNGCGVHYVSAAVTNFDHPEMSSFEDPKPQENDNSKIAHKNSEKLWELNSPDAFRRSATRIWLDGVVNCGEDIIYPSDVQGEVLVLTEPSARAFQTEAEFSGSFYDSKSVESPKTSLTLRLDGEAFKAVDLETHLEMNAQSPSEQNRGVKPELYQDGHAAKSSKQEEVGQLKPVDDGLDCSFESQELNSSVRTKFSAVQDKIDPGNGDSVAISDVEYSLQYNELNDDARTNFSLIQDQDLPDDGDPIAACDVQGVFLCQRDEGTQIVVGGEGTELEQSSTAGANTESKHCLLNDRNMPSEGHGVCSEMKIKEESVSMEAFFVMKAPSTGEDAETEKCAMSRDKSLDVVADTLDDQPELRTEAMDKEMYESDAAMYVKMHETYVGQEEPMNLEKRNFNELKSPHHLIAFTEVAITDKSNGYISISVHSPPKKTDENYQDSGEDPGVAYGRMLSHSADTNFQKEEAFSDTVDSEKHSELRTQSSKQRNGVYRDFLTEANINLEEGLIIRKLANSEEVAHLMDQQRAFDDHSLHEKMDSSVTHKLSSIQDQVISGSDTIEVAESCGVIPSPPHVATTQIIEGRCSELEFSVRNSSAMSSSPTNSNSIFKFHSVGTKFKSNHCFLTDDNGEIQGNKACFEGERKEETDSEPALFIIQAPPTSNDAGLERSDMLMDGRLTGVIEVVSGVGSMSEGLESERNCFSDCKAAKEREIQENVHDEGGGPIDKGTSNSIEAEAVSPDIEVDGCPFYAEHTALQNSNENEQVDGCPLNAAHIALRNSYENEEVQTSELSFTEPVSTPNSVVKENASNHENEMELVMMSIGMEREEGLCQFDEKPTKEKQEDEVKTLFGISIASCENNTVQAPESGALHNSISHVASAEDGDGSILEECDGTLLQHDEQKIDGLNFQGEIDVEEETLKYDEHAESGAKIDMISLEIKIPPAERKDDSSFPFDHTQDAERVTSLAAMLFETQVNVPRINAEVMVSDIQEPAASESSASKHHLVFNESEVADLESVEILLTRYENANCTSQGHLLTKVAELVPSFQPEAVSVEEPVVPAGENTVPDKELDQGKAADLVKTETKLISGTTTHANADRVAAVEHNLVSNLKTASTRSKNVGAVAVENISSAAKYTPKRKNARTILIHGTPNKLQMAAHMKESAPSSKLEKVGSLTSVRPAAKRSALKHLPWK